MAKTDAKNRKIVREVKKAVNRYSLYGSVPCDVLDNILEGGSLHEPTDPVRDSGVGEGA